MGWVARWVLLACTLFGLAAMHTLGHAGMHGPGMGESTGHSAGMQVLGSTAVMQAVADGVTGDGDGGCAGDGCAHWGSRHGGGGDMAGWSVCVAVLTGFAIFLLLALLWSRITARKTPPCRGADSAGGARSPPIRHVGLVLARVSVLRV